MHLILLTIYILENLRKRLSLKQYNLLLCPIEYSVYLRYAKESENPYLDSLQLH